MNQNTIHPIVLGVDVGARVFPDSFSATSADPATSVNCARPTSPIPTILPVKSSVGRSRESSTSTTRLDFSSMAPTSTKPP